VSESPDARRAGDSPVVSVVLPTYEEAEALPRIVPRILDALREASIPAEVIVVDDDSPDGTADVARTLGETLAVRVIHRTEERGLATAAMAGFAASSAPVCVVMDADGSHPVKVLPEMVRAIQEDRADIVVGSRNVPGGGSEGWPLWARIKSKLAALPTRLLTSLTDPTTGFMAVRRDLFDTLELDPIGWKIVLETVVKSGKARLMEVPIVFTDREAGWSKQSLQVAMDYGRHVERLYGYRYPAALEFVRFCLVGFAGLGVDLAVVVLLKEAFHLDTRLCAIGGFSVAVTSNYILNRAWTFSHGRSVPISRSYPTYVAANLLGLGVRLAIVHVGMTRFQLDHGHGYVITNFLGIVAGTLTNFLGSKFVAFGGKR